MYQKYDANSHYSTGEMEISFPERREYVISSQNALEAIQKAIEQIKSFRKDRLQIFEKCICPLVPDSLRNLLNKFNLNNISVAYDSLIDVSGKLLSFLFLLGLEDSVDHLKAYNRFIILPFIELKLRKKIEKLEQDKPWFWKIKHRLFKKYLDAITPIVDNMMNLVSLAWTFCPGIGEPEKETGFYNRFVFTSNGGFIDLGHFFNCALVAYFYGEQEATKRGESTEVEQRLLRQKHWLNRMRERGLLGIVTNLLWGYATSADTIEDRASDKLGIILGEYMRNQHNNSKIIDYFIEFFPKLVHLSYSDSRRKAGIFRLIDSIRLLAKIIFYRLGNGTVVDIEKYMAEFFDEYDAIDPKDSSVVPKGLFCCIIDFYTEKYGGNEWDSYTNKEWQVVIPQDLWERVVRGRNKFEEKALPIKIQLKNSGRLVAPYQ